MSDQIDQQPLYSIGTWDAFKEDYTPQRGLSVPSFNCTRKKLRVALKELKAMGYSCHRRRADDGSYEDNDTSVLIERTDGMSAFEIRRNWRR